MNISASTRFAAVGIISTFICLAQSPGPGMPASTAARILEQATWGPTPSGIQTLQQQGFDTWFQNQLTAPVSTFPSQPMLNSAGKAFGNMNGLQVTFFENALYNPDQLRQRVAFALSEIWVVSKEGTIGYANAFPFLLNTFQNDAFGSYLQLMTDVTLNPAMGQYLDMVNNHKASGSYVPNENYGRELMQLFTIGLNNLNPDGTPVLVNGSPLPTYTQATVTGMSNALTGWTYAPTPTGQTGPNYTVPMVVQGTGGQHDTTQKLLPFTYPDGTVHTTTLSAGQTPMQDLEGALAALAQNPNMAPFISKQLIQHLVTSNPSPAYVLRVSEVFSAYTGNSQQLQKVVYAILTDPEARAGDNGVSANPAGFGKMREPVLWVMNLLQGLNGTIFDASTVYNYTANLGQNLFYSPSVFSYFSPSYHVGPLLAPEFQLYSTQTAVTRSNYTYAAIYNGHLDANTTFDITPFVTAAGTSTAALETAISNQFFHGMMSSALQTAINNGLTGLTTPTSKAQAALLIALTSGEYLVMQ